MDINKYVCDVFKDRKPVVNKLLRFGFARSRNVYVYSEDLLDGEYQISITVSKNGVVSAEVTSALSSGQTSKKVKKTPQKDLLNQCEILLGKINDDCFEYDYCDNNVFQSDLARQIIVYAREKYGDELEFLWRRYPNNAIIRRKDNAKWYAALLTVEQKKLNFPIEGTVEIIDLKAAPESIQSIIDGVKFLPGYHMNKQNWITIRLDGSVSIEEICRKIDDSYILAGK